MKKLKTIISFALLFAILLSLLLVNTTSVSAHEMYYDNGVPIVMKWNFVTNRVANLKMCNYNLTGKYLTNYPIARAAWPNASARVSVTETAFSSSNVDLLIPDVGNSSASVESVMRQGALGYYEPKSHDITDLNNKY